MHEFSELCERLDSDVPHASDARAESPLKARARAIVRSQHFYYFMSAVSILNAVALYLPRLPAAPQRSMAASGPGLGRICALTRPHLRRDSATSAPGLGLRYIETQDALDRLSSLQGGASCEARCACNRNVRSLQPQRPRGRRFRCIDASPCIYGTGPAVLRRSRAHRSCSTRRSLGRRASATRRWTLSQASAGINSRWALHGYSQYPCECSQSTHVSTKISASLCEFSLSTHSAACVLLLESTRCAPRRCCNVHRTL